VVSELKSKDFMSGQEGVGLRFAPDFWNRVAAF
jgi:hypothetical protein